MSANFKVTKLRQLDSRAEGLDLRILSTKQGWTCELLRDGEPIRSDLVRMFEAIPAWFADATASPSPPATPPPDAPSCDTLKITYATIEAAEDAVTSLTRKNLRHDRPGRTAARSYRCGRCGLWHVTSEPFRSTY